MDNPHILLSGADTPERGRLIEALTERGFALETVSEGGALLAEVETRPADLVLSAVTLPDIAPDALLDRLSERYPGLPVVFLADPAERHLAAPLLRRGACDVLFHPVDPAVADSAIRAALRRAALLRDPGPADGGDAVHSLRRSLDARSRALEFANRQLSALADVSTRFTQMRDEKTFLDMVPRVLADVLDFDRGILVMAGDKGLHLRSSWFAKDPPELVARFRERMSRRDFPVPRAVQECFESARTLFIADLNQDPRWPKTPGEIIRTKALVIAPIVVQGKPVGVLVGNMQHHRRDMDPQDVARFEMFTNLVGLTLTNIRAYSDLEAQIAERTHSLHTANAELQEKARELERKTYSLGMANVKLLSVQETLETRNAEMEQLLAELSKKTDELQAILDASPSAIVMVNREGRVTAVNQRIEEFFGFRGSDVLHRPFAEFEKRITPLFSDGARYASVVREIEKLVVGGDGSYDVRDLYNRALLLDGPVPRTVVPVPATVSDPDGAELGRIYIYNDITQIHKADQLLHTILEASPIPSIVSRLADGEVLYANEPLARLVGVPIHEVIGRRTPDFYANPADREEVLGILKRDGFVKDTEVQVRSRNGDPIWMIFSLVTTELNGETVIIGALYDINERRMAEQALKREQAFVSAILDTAGALVTVLDLEGRVVRFNRACERVTGYTFEEVRERPFWDVLLRPEEVEPVKNVFFNLTAGHFPSQFENHWRTRDGRLRLIAWSNTVLTDDAGAVTHVIATGIDVTERRQMEENLRLYRKIFMNSNDAVAILTRDGRIIEVNPAASAIYGYEAAELVGQTTATLIGEGPYRELLASLPDRGNYAVRREVLTRTKAGRELYVELSAFPILDDDDDVIYRVGFARDITERKRAEKALHEAMDELEVRVENRTAELRESEARNKALLDAIPDLMFRLNREGLYLDYQAPTDSDLALPRDQVVGRHIAETMPADLARSAQKAIRRALDRNGIEILEYTLPHHNHVHYFEARIVVSGPDEVISIVRDITERKQAEEALRTAHEELEERVRERTRELARTVEELRDTQAQLVQSEKMASLGMLVAGIAHEINTPVGAISSMHNTLVRAVGRMKDIIEKADPDLVEKQPRLAAMFKAMEDANRVIASGTERVTTIVKRLRSFARLDEAELKEGDIHEGIEDTLVLIHHEIKHHITVERRFTDNMPLIPHFPGKLNQVLLNLLINARQAIGDRPDGRIVIATAHRERTVFIEISDNGIGIPAENLGKVFDPGFTTKGVGVGTGLGLSIVYQIIHEDHRGDIRVRSVPGEGTTFEIRFPDHLDEILDHT